MHHSMTCPARLLLRIPVAVSGADGAAQAPWCESHALTACTSALSRLFERSCSTGSCDSLGS